MIAPDTETTGLDLYHGCAPYIVSFCNENQENTTFVWDVDPLTRQPLTCERDLDVIEELLDSDDLVFLNATFDVKALGNARQAIADNWDWSKTEDIGFSGHILASNHRQDLTTMAMEYLSIDLRPFEEAVKQATIAARKIVQTEKLGWKIAYEGMPELPSCKDKDSGKGESQRVWKNDMWVPRAVAKHFGYGKDHPWWTVTEIYANADTAATIAIWQVHKELMQHRKLTKIYQYRNRLLPAMFSMWERGASMNKTRAKMQLKKFKSEYVRCKTECVEIAKSYDYDLEMPKAASNSSLMEFVFGAMNLPVTRWTDKGAASLDKYAVEDQLITLNEGTREHTFIKNLSDFRGAATHIGYMESYIKYWLPLGQSRINKVTGEREWLYYCIHPGLNPNGSDTLRWSSTNPNSQSISKKKKYNLRKSFGPAPGREWYSMDAMNIELRIPAFESGQKELIALFEEPDKPPYYGSEHVLNFSVVYPDLWEQAIKESGGLDKAGPWIKANWNHSWYQWCKNGDFAIQYGAIDREDGSGTADKAFHKAGAHSLLKSRFTLKEKLNQKYISFAKKHGYVETLPDRTVDPDRGYPLLCTRNSWGGILETVPLSYHVQSSAMWVTMRAMILVQEFLDEYNRGKQDKDKVYLILQVHDEIVLDFPYKEDKGNLPVVFEICDIISRIGNDLVPSMPLPFGVEKHPLTWADGEKLR